MRDRPMSRWPTYLILIVLAPSALAVPLDKYIQRFSSETGPQLIQRYGSPIYVPVESIEYTYSQGFAKKFSYHEGTDIFSFRLKPLHDMLYTSDARALVEKLNYQTLQHRNVSASYQQHLAALNQLLSARVQDLTTEMTPFFDRYFRNRKTLATANPESLKQILELQSKVELMKQTQGIDNLKSSQSERKALAELLVAKVNTVVTFLKSIDSTSLMALQKTELELDRVENKINSHSATNASTFFEIRNDTIDYETSFRVGIRIPLEVVSDDDERARAKLFVKESRYFDSLQTARNKLKIEFHRLHILASQIGILEKQSQSLERIMAENRNRHSSKIATTAKLLLYENQISTLEKTLKFYQASLTVMKDLMMFNGNSSPLTAAFNRTSH